MFLLFFLLIGLFNVTANSVPNYDKKQVKLNLFQQGLARFSQYT